MSIRSTRVIQLLLITTSSGAVSVVDTHTGKYFQIATGLPEAKGPASPTQAPLDYLIEILLQAREKET